MLDLVVAGRLDPTRLITRRIGLDDVPDALAAMSTSSPTGVTVIAP
jgi:threonine dehydrogenase-like Zn-dependent dehydrogenase